MTSLFAQGGYVVALLLSLKASEMSTNVTSVEPVQRINPELIGSLDRVDSNSAAQAGVPVRRLTRLDADYYAALDRMPTRSIPRPRTGTPATPPDDRAWLRALERAVGGWAPTLRGSLVVVAVFLTAAILLAVAMGVAGLLLSGGTAAVLIWMNATGRLPRA
ncbi:MAG TPA: hypothetical protein VHF06_28100 [Pseudonocardiaceae bacterium]|nr:hypothetical protein [Pseudonocardiaceae bacterium]